MERKEATENHILCRLDNWVGSELSLKGVKKIIAGISGGADSVALLRALLNSGVEVEAVHCNFHLRGEESNRDEQFVRELCAQFDVPLDVVDFDVESYRRQHGGSVEMACRDLRYEYFENKRMETQADRIAVAHNSDDNAETLLLNLFRGAGIAGLRAMKKDTGKVIRPLLEVSRKEIEEYLDALGQPYIVDSTNLTSDYRRNFIRNDVIPLIEREWPDVKRSLNRTSCIMAAEEEGIDSFVKEIMEADILSYEMLCRPLSGRWLLRKFVLKKGGTDHIVNEIVRSVESAEIRKGARWESRGGEFIFGQSGLEWLPTEESQSLEDNGRKFSWESFENTPELINKIRADRSNSSFWTPLSPDEVDIRLWREGDRIKPLGMKGSRLVSDVIGEAKFPAVERRKVVLAVEKSSGEILWVERIKRSRKALVNQSDKVIWRLQRK